MPALSARRRWPWRSRRRKRRLVLGRQYFLEMTTPVESATAPTELPTHRRLRSYQETLDAEASGDGPSSGGGRKFAMLNWVAAPRDSKGFEPHNRLLAALSGRDLQSLQPHIEAVPLARGSVLFEVGEPLTRVCFVESGVVSLLTAFYNRVAVGWSQPLRATAGSRLGLTWAPTRIKGTRAQSSRPLAAAAGARGGCSRWTPGLVGTLRSPLATNHILVE